MDIVMNRGNDQAYEAMFDEHIGEVFGFSFAPWFERKLWNERYESYAVIEEGRMLSNICVYKTQMLVSGEAFFAIQLGGVSTRKQARGRGLSRLLMEHVLRKYPDVPAFLGANGSVGDFYPRFGFRPVQTYHPQIEALINNADLEAFMLEKDDPLVTRAIQGRAQHSAILDSLNTQPIQHFHLLLDYPQSIYHLPHCGALVVAQQEGDTLFLADVITLSPVRFDALCRELPFCGVHKLRFGFCPDWLGLSPQWVPIDMAREPYFIRGDWRLPNLFRFPVMSET